MFKFGTILTFLTTLLCPTIATAESVKSYGPPVIRGNYYVCPNGKTLPKNFFRLPEYSNLKDLDYGVGWEDSFINDSKQTIYKKVSKLSHANSKVIVGKKVRNYDYETIERLKYKMLNEGINAANPYESYSIRPLYSDYTWNVSHWEFLFKNSEGKTLKIKDEGYRAEIINSQGKTFTSKEYDAVGFLYCTPNNITLKFVRDITLQDITNQYGELVTLPMMFWMVEIGFKTELPKSQNEIGF